MHRFARPFESRLLFCAVVATVLGSAAGAYGANDAPPVPADGQQVPKHAAGGWPTDLTGDDKKVQRTPEQQKAIDEVAGELKRIANTYGPDSVVLQSKLLIRSMSAGAIGATEVKVAGPSTGEAGPGHLEIDIETGFVFDEKTTTDESRRETVWKDVAAPVLDEMVSFNIEPRSLELVFLFDVQSGNAGEAPTVSADSRHEAFRVRLTRELLEEIAANRIAGDAMREKAVLTPVVTVVRPAAAATD